MIDETDLKIIEELKKDGRASFSQIADEIGIATSTVTGRFQKLKDEGIITDFSPRINYEKLGFGLTVMIDLKAEADKLQDAADKLESNTRVLSFFQVTGGTDMVIVSRFLDREDMNNFIKRLQQVEGVKSTNTKIILTEPKLDDNMDLKKILEEKKT